MYLYIKYICIYIYIYIYICIYIYIHTYSYMNTSMTSRVVPGVGDTSAAGRLARTFSSVLLPEFGGPTSATCFEH